MRNWQRVYPGVYESRVDREIAVKRHCECGHNCAFAWAIYRGDEAIETMFFHTRAQASQAATRLIEMGR